MEETKNTTTKEKEPFYHKFLFWRLATAPQRYKNEERAWNDIVEKGEALIAAGQAMRAAQH